MMTINGNGEKYVVTTSKLCKERVNEYLALDSEIQQLRMFLYMDLVICEFDDNVLTCSNNY